MSRIRYSFSQPREKRKHYINAIDVETLLSRLPENSWARLRHVHFNDRSRGCRCLGYVNMGHREIAICALPPRVSLTRFLVHRTSTRLRTKSDAATVRSDDRSAMAGIGCSTVYVVRRLPS